MFEDLREKPQYEPTPEEIAELLSKILKGERRSLKEREVDFLASILGKGRELLRKKLVKTGQPVRLISIDTDHETKVEYAPLTAAQESSTIEEALTIILERLKTEGIENPIELLIKKVVRQRKRPNLSKNTLEIIERIKRISEEIAGKIAERLTEDKDKISKILEAFAYRFNRAVFGKAFNVGKKAQFAKEQITSILDNSILAYVFDSDQEKCNAVVEEKAQTEDPAVVAILEFRKQFLERINEILGQDKSLFPQKYLERRRLTILKKLLHFLNDWSDETPKEILHAKGKFKVRINWWNGIVGNLHQALQLELIKDPATAEECRTFIRKYGGTDHWNQGEDRTKKEDIEKANELLGKVTKALGQPASTPPSPHP